ncbi:DUF4430 domain-containing protein [Sediminibacillus halophilus]|uniref:Transcobalamin-like C-terminal domain-containing protein n=1 Tax=Sediminibacillus halophilus TaxID=482461 RepID=A0A1G9LT51_9BACI|nr:DUF4430 domain-containing protein [Sediminibacillus halophilus]SDL65156.1 protein of unknown function [Sediminibacillus halophilus]
MKKFLFVLLSLLFAAGIVTGCAEQNQDTSNNETAETTEQSGESESQEVVTVTISEDEGENVIAEKEVEIEDGAILLDVMKENFEVEESDGFITSIEGVSQNEEEGKYWMYSVNGEMAEVGANEYELNPDDEITFDLHAME